MTTEDIRIIALPACREFNVRRLDAFGSTARGSATSSSAGHESALEKIKEDIVRLKQIAGIRK